MSKLAGVVRAITNPRQAPLAPLALLAATNKDKESHRHSTREIVIRIRTVPIYEGMRCRSVRCGMPSRMRIGLNAKRSIGYCTRVFASHVGARDRKSTRLNSSHANISYAVFCL